MNNEIFAIAVVKPQEGHHDDVVNILHDLYEVMTRKKYSRNILYRDEKDTARLINMRYWASEQARRDAQEDPEVHRQWVRLAEVATVELVFECLLEVPMGSGSAAR